ncbi:MULTISPECIES: hypothetical protein [Vibrio]|uniref:hypothetical protein n=1 Tax=Vibrio TaxID=662 RepID=UPI002943336B|nr:MULTISPECIES: hypothetical protein [Vibrio]MDW2080766.1 hypothetical protein [Vibrio sp. 1640]
MARHDPAVLPYWRKPTRQTSQAISADGAHETSECIGWRQGNTVSMCAAKAGECLMAGSRSGLSAARSSGPVMTGLLAQ